eukprot:CAMPEP_0181248692 /NCGR_PEP_ID=MMETSP1096-20121128/45317_1 /TAXON_ID=156174 ORGANISM="Chrysochromulina ericina, Strain CCMP281" /NCGR_SAMPLE_ID=MMETSP1096 /ASSEMBLY_ACC=CAM_ASM_000453 /LENGTH=49 /DNA_ID= /DNA_START= /DNA_END= /DNA_ORIENTATION=
MVESCPRGTGEKTARSSPTRESSPSESEQSSVGARCPTDPTPGRRALLL